MRTKKLPLYFLIGLAMLPLSAAPACAAGPAAPNTPTVAVEPGRGAGKFAVCVFCGASDLADPKFAATAYELGHALAARGWVLVWGGAKTGLMGAVARGVKENGGHVFGVIPEFIKAWEVGFDSADELVTVTTMSERKIFLQSRADVFVMLPGGLGTLDEICDTLELRQLDRHRKTIVLLNQDGYYDKLIQFLDEGVRARFNRAELMGKFSVASTLDELLSRLEIESSKRGPQ